jgi:hypothetical protein
LRLRLLSFTAALMALSSPSYAVMEDYPSIKLQGLDKSVGRTTTFEAKVGSTIQYGPLFIKIHACRKSPPIEAPESAAFLQVWEVPPGSQKSEWVFSGWMFASSPALSAMDHPVYDVWVLDCTGREEPNEEAAAAATDEQADQTSLPAADQPPSDTTPSQDMNQGIPSDQTVSPAAEENIPVDGEADMGVPDPAQPQPSLPLGSTAPYDPYSPQQPAPPTESQDGVYSPSQGKVVPFNPYGQY